MMGPKINPRFTWALILFMIAGYLLAEWRGVFAAILIHVGMNFWLTEWVNNAIDTIADRAL